MYDFPVHDYTQEQNGSPYFSSIVRQCKWPSLSRKIVVIQKFSYRGNLTSHFSSLLADIVEVTRRWHPWLAARNGELARRLFCGLQETDYTLIQKSTGKGFHCTHPSDCRSLSSIFVDTSAKDPSWSPRAIRREHRVLNWLPCLSYRRIE